jgi:heme exporter protein D
MPDLGPHAGFILAAYGVTLIAVSALVLAIVADDRHQRHVLAALEKKGIRRRSAKSEATVPPPASASRKRPAAKTRKPNA